MSNRIKIKLPKTRNEKQYKLKQKCQTPKVIRIAFPCITVYRIVFINWNFNVIKFRVAREKKKIREKVQNTVQSQLATWVKCLFGKRVVVNGEEWGAGGIEPRGKRLQHEMSRVSRKCVSVLPPKKG